MANPIQRRALAFGASIAVLVAGLLVTVQPTVEAATIPELQKQKQSLEKQLKADQAARAKKQEEQKALTNQIKTLETEISKVEGKISDTQGKIEATEAAIQTKTREITAKEADLVREKDHQAETLRVLYETGNASPVELLIGSGSFSDVLVYNEYLDALEARIEQTIDETARIKAELEASQAELEGEHANLSRLKGEQLAYQRALDNQQTEKEQLRNNAKAVEARLASQIEDAQKVYADVNNELTKLMEAARRRFEARGRGEIPKGVSNLGFQYPVAYEVVSTYFGGRTPFQSFHTGLDLVNVSGTPVVAAADGVVTYLGTLSYGYGRHVIITHNERFSTVYAHFEGFFDGLEVGQTVKRGDPLGYVGSTGWSTGPHLHFEIREYGVPVDPFDYLPT